MQVGKRRLLILSFLTGKGQRVTPSMLAGVSGHERMTTLKILKVNCITSDLLIRAMTILKGLRKMM